MKNPLSTPDPIDPASPILPAQARPKHDTQVEFIKGTGPRLTDETQHLLQARIQAAGLILSVAVGIFFIHGLFLLRPPRCGSCTSSFFFF